MRGVGGHGRGGRAGQDRPDEAGQGRVTPGGHAAGKWGASENSTPPPESAAAAASPAHGAAAPLVVAAASAAPAAPCGPPHHAVHEVGHPQGAHAAHCQAPDGGVAVPAGGRDVEPGNCIKTTGSCCGWAAAALRRWRWRQLRGCSSCHAPRGPRSVGLLAVVQQSLHHQQRHRGVLSGSSPEVKVEHLLQRQVCLG